MMTEILDKSDFLRKMDVALDDYDYNFEMHGATSIDCVEDKKWLTELCNFAIEKKWIPKKFESNVEINDDTFFEKAYWCVREELDSKGIDWYNSGTVKVKKRI